MQNLSEVQEDVKTVYTFDNGYRVVELTSKSSLQLEAKRMNNCIDNPRYWEQIVKGEQRHFSLRDKQNNPHVTIEYEVAQDSVTQIKGYANYRPDKQYYSMLLEFLKSLTKNYRCYDYKNLEIVFVNGNPFFLRDVIENNLEMDGEVVLPVDYAMGNPSIGNVRSSGVVGVDYIGCGSITGLYSKERVQIDDVNCNHIGSIQSPYVVSSISFVESIDTIVVDNIVVNGGKYGVIGNISCEEHTLFERVIVDKVSCCSTPNGIFAINHSCVNDLSLDNICILLVKNSKIAVHWGSVGRHYISDSDIELIDSRVEQDVLFDSCNVRLRNTHCNSLFIENSSKSSLTLDEKSTVANLTVCDVIDGVFLSNIKRYSSKIEYISSIDANQDVIVGNGFKFKPLRQEIKVAVKKLEQEFGTTYRVALLMLSIDGHVGSSGRAIHAAHDPNFESYIFPIYKVIPKSSWKYIYQYFDF